MKKIVIIIISIIISAILIFIGASLIIANKHIIKLNETADIKEDKIKLTVLGSEKVTIDKEALEIGDYTWENEANGEYIKVKLSIENYGSETYNIGGTTFSLGDEIISLFAMGEDDYIEQEIQPGKTATGYLYFLAVDDTLMTYRTHMEVTSSSTVEVKQYYFSID